MYNTVFVSAFVCCVSVQFSRVLDIAENMSEKIQNMSDLFLNMCLVFFICSERGFKSNIPVFIFSCLF